MEPDSMNNTLIYVYCISDSPDAILSSMESIGLKSIKVNDFYVIVKYVFESEFSKENLKNNSSDIQWLETNAREHIGVITKVMEMCTVIPFNFGTIFQSEDSLKKFLEDYTCSLTENFQHIRSKEEWAVKIYCDRNALKAQIDELSEQAANLEKEIKASSPGKAFLLQRKKNDLVENEIDRICNNWGQEYYNEFNSNSDSTCLNSLLPKEYTGREDTMIINAAFLVTKNKVDEFLSKVDLIRKKDGNTNFKIETTGPWPPFSFISIKERI
jgi:hypothetical protein